MRFCLVLTTAQVLLALLLFWNRRRTPPLLPEAPADGEEASVLVLVPARNEEDNIEACVTSLLRQTHRRLEVRVIDDHSTDRTAERVRALGLRDARLSLLAAPELPPGWLGKPHALHFGTRGAAADYLLFVDADLRLEPDAVGRALRTAQAEQAALLTVVPRLLCESFWERAIQPVVALLVLGLFVDPGKVADPRSRVAAANGPFLLFRRDAYERIGGHQSVAAEVVEDLRLAERVKDAGLRLAYRHGTAVARLRMYDSLRAILAGWGKNFYVAFGGRWWLAPPCALLLLLVLGAPTLLPWAGAARVLLGRGPGLLYGGLLAYGADWLARWSLHRNYQVTLRGARFLGAAAVAYILCRSVYRAAAGKTVSWRGREYAT